MKFIRDNVAFVELDDIRFLGVIPEFVSMKRKQTPKSDTQYEKFTTKDCVDYFKNQEAIIDYDSISNLTDEELETKVQELKEELNKSQNNLKKIKSLTHILLTVKRYQENRSYYDEVVSRLSFKKYHKKEEMLSIKESKIKKITY